MGPDEAGAVDERLVVAAPPVAVWKAITDAVERRAWWSYLELDAVEGGRFVERWKGSDGASRETSGSVLAAVPERLLRLSWADEGWAADTEVEFELVASEDGTEVRVRHSGWHRLPGGDRLADDHRAGWRMHLEHLRAHLEA